MEESEEEDEEEGSELDDGGGSWLLAKSCVMICCKTERKSEGNDRGVTKHQEYECDLPKCGQPGS